MLELDYLAVIVRNATAVDEGLCGGEKVWISVGIDVYVLGEALGHHGYMAEHLGGREKTCGKGADRVCAALFIAVAEETVKASNVSLPFPNNL